MAVPVSIGPPKLGYLDGTPVQLGITKDKMEPLKDMKIFPDDIFIGSYPKGGTTWVQQVLKLILNNGFEDGEYIHKSIPWLDIEGEPALQQPSPRCFKTHLPYSLVRGGLPHTTQARYIYTARNPKDTAVSYYFHTLSFKHYKYNGDWNDYFEHYVEGQVACGSWFDHVLGWWAHSNANNILFIKYEDLHKDISGNIQKIGQFLGHHLSSSVLENITKQSSFKSMSENPTTNYSWMTSKGIRDGNLSPFMRKGVVGDWRNFFTEEQSERLDKLYIEKIIAAGLHFDFLP